MILDKNEREALEKLGLGIDPTTGKIVEKQASQAIDKEALTYCGFNTYIDCQTNRLFEKVGSELIELQTPEIGAEQRFIDRHMQDPSTLGEGESDAF